ncbi:MAG: DUF4198 domain-containing protein [bacterium]|nr:DUF4198 domain-containing protein [bacterium]
MTVKAHRRAVFLGAVLSSLLAGAALAHDFWIQPSAFWVAPQSVIPVSLQVGHGPNRQRWEADADRVTGFYSLGSFGKFDRIPELRAGDMSQDHPLKFTTPGVQILVLTTSNTQSELPGLRFDAYLKDEGLTPAIDARAAAKANDMPGRELYSRRAKALVQVGPALAKPQALVIRPVGLTLEIVPEVDPYVVGAGESVPVRVIYQGKPLAGALVKLNNLDFDGRPIQQVTTDAAGRAVFKIPRFGSWQLNVIWTKALRGDPKADFETVFSSLTLGFPRNGAAR